MFVSLMCFYHADHLSSLSLIFSKFLFNYYSEKCNVNETIMQPFPKVLLRLSCVLKS